MKWMKIIDIFIKMNKDCEHAGWIEWGLWTFWQWNEWGLWTLWQLNEWEVGDSDGQNWPLPEMCSGACNILICKCVYIHTQ